ncbi:TetR/AcrR family transcriptional regulator [Brevundimonas naejangsanensis]|uniref:TetR/AcrR family transcriptional regulator n=1 Tax=Brevundimonas naejangsanensis TaxID=588932 RepID=UPI003F7662F7
MDGATFPSVQPAPDLAAAEPPARLNRRQAAKRRTRQRVLAAATDLFNDVGYAKGTIRAIAKRAGMSTGAVFANFIDKDDLYVAAFGHPPLTPEQGLRLAAALREAEAFIRGFDDDPLQEGIPELLQAIKAALPPPPPAPAPATGGADA